MRKVLIGLGLEVKHRRGRFLCPFGVGVRESPAGWHGSIWESAMDFRRKAVIPIKGW